MSGFDKEKIIDKIQKLLRLSTSPNEHEASLALQRAHELLSKYNLSTADLKEESPVSHKDQKFGQSHGDQDRYIVMLLVDHFEVELIRIRYPGAQKIMGNCFHIIGEKHSIIIAEHVFEYLRSTFRRMWKIRAQTLTKKRMRRKTVSRIRQSYYYGIWYTLDAALIAAKPVVPPGEGLIVSKSDALKKYIIDNFKTTTSNKVMRRKLHDAGFLEGRSDGKNISINKAIQQSAGQIKLLQ